MTSQPSNSEPESLSITNWPTIFHPLLSNPIKNSHTNHKIFLYRFFKLSRSQRTNPNVVEDSWNLYRDHCRQVKRIYLFVHGAGGCAEQFSLLMHHISRAEKVQNRERYGREGTPSQIQMFSYDWYGHRESFDEKRNSWAEYSADKMRSDLEFVLKQCVEEVQRLADNQVLPEIVLVAHSYGTSLLMKLLADRIREEMDHDSDKSFAYLEQIKKVVLLSTTDACPSAASSVLWKAPSFFVELIRPILSSTNRQMMYHIDTNDSIVDYWSEMASQNSISMMKALCRQMDWYSLDDAKLIKEERNDWSITIIQADKDSVTQTDGAERVAYACSAEFHKLEEVAHNLMVERPSAIASMILDIPLLVHPIVTEHSAKIIYAPTEKPRSVPVPAHPQNISQQSQQLSETQLSPTEKQPSEPSQEQSSEDAPDKLLEDDNDPEEDNNIIERDQDEKAQETDKHETKEAGDSSDQSGDSENEQVTSSEEIVEQEKSSEPEESAEQTQAYSSNEDMTPKNDQDRDSSEETQQDS